MWTKGQLVAQAFAEIAIAGYEYDLTPEEQQSALRQLDAMLAAWEVRGIRVGYLFPSSPADSSLNSDSGIPDGAVEAVYLTLAIRIASGKGKTLAPQTLTAAREAYAPLLKAAAYPQQQQLKGTLPAGQGNPRYRWRHPFLNPPHPQALAVTPGGDLDILE